MLRSLLALTFVVATFTMHADQGALQVADAHDWGTVRMPKAGYVETDLRIKNVATSGTLNIVEVRPGCGCTSAEPDKRALAPGEEAIVHIKLNISPTQSGPLHKAVTVRTVHGTDTLSKVVMLKVDVQRMVSMSPVGYIAINNARVGQASTAVVTITNPGTQPVTITKVATEGGLKADLAENTVLAPSARREVTVTLTPEKAGQFYGLLRFTATGNGDPEDMQLPTYGTAEPATEK